MVTILVQSRVPAIRFLGEVERYASRYSSPVHFYNFRLDDVSLNTSVER